MVKGTVFYVPAVFGTFGGLVSLEIKVLYDRCVVADLQRELTKVRLTLVLALVKTLTLISAFVRS